MSPTTDRQWKPSPHPRTPAEPEAVAEETPATVPDAEDTEDSAPDEQRRRRIRPALARLRFRPGGLPPALVVSTAAWGVAAFLTVWAGSDALGSDPGQRYAQDVRDQLGDGTVATATQVHPQDVLALVVGACLFTVLIFALLKRRWARPALSVVAVAAVIVLAFGGHWEAAIVFFAFVVGAVTLLAESVQRALADTQDE
jgi:hypothetical protein